MNTDDSQQLLAEYVDNASEPAFCALVARYINPVYSTALRLVGGDAHLAQDITQTVFADLARKAAKLPPATLLGGWLHRDTCFVASKALRSERRRQFREREAVAMNAQEDHSAANLALVAPILDDAINQLEPADRTAILLRFFEQLDFRAIGEKMGSNEDAARMRVNRALEKMEVMLKHRGVTLSAAALGTALAIGFVSAAPLGLAATVAGTALAGASAGGITAPILKLISMSHLKIALIGTAAVAALAVPAVMQHQSLAKLRDENQSLSNQIVQLAPLQEENQRLSNRVAQATSSQTPTDQQVHELARLRGQVALLTQQTNDLARALASAHWNGRAGTVALFTRNGKRVFHGITMPEFARFLGGIVGFPVTDQTGLIGAYDIEMTPSFMVGGDAQLPNLWRELRDELGLQLLAFPGPFTAEEKAAARQYAHIVTYNAADNSATLTTNAGGLALKVEHFPALGIKAADGEPFPDEQGDGNSLGRSDAGASLGPDLKNLPPQVANKLRLIDSAKQQWALEHRKRNADTPTWDDLAQYIASGPNGDISAFTKAPEGVYSINSVGSMPGFNASTGQLAQVWRDNNTAGPLDKAAADENACINNLRMIDSAKQQWALEFHKTANDTPTVDDIKPYMGRGPDGEFPVCPDGGVYIIGKVGEIPTCSIPGHILP